MDFIGPSKALRHLFSLPYSTDRNVSVALHTMGNGTILLDSGEDASSSAGAMMFHNSQENPSPRPGRRRRPRSWSTDDNNHHHPPLENDNEKDKQHKLQVQNYQDEKSLLASLSLLLEEERQMEKIRYEKELSVVVERGANVIGDELPKESTSIALVHPQTTLVRQEGLGEDVTIPATETKATVFSQSIQQQQQKQTTPTNEEPDDMLANKLHPPTHYLRHAITPPTEPNQYLHWNFKGMNVLVASDANIYSHSESSDENTTNTSPQFNNSKSIVVKVADTSDLKSQMECHQSMRHANTIIPNIEQARKALPPSSYVEALLKEKEEGIDASLCNVTLQTRIIPSINMGNQFAEYGFSISPTQSTDDFKKGAVSKPIMDNPNSIEQPTVDSTTSSQQVPYSSTPCCTVMDTYLDNIMANVPQLALILRDHGFISNIKLMQTEDIPYLLMHPSTLDSSVSYPDSTPEPIFSLEIVEMNAAMLLRFLKTNCTKENSTYLLHRSAGEPNLQLFDISSISQLRQRKWIWWLALCSYRFACRLEQLQTNILSPHDKATRREYRKRQRSLLHNTLDLLQELADMDGGKHETIGAAVCEHLADTYLWNDEADGEIGLRDPHKPAPLASLSHPYGKVTVDCLNKAQDHLTKAIGVLSPLLVKAKEDKSSIELEAFSLQLFGIHHKLINVCLRLADNHLQSYFSSNLIQSLRTASRMLSDAADLLITLDLLGFDKSDEATPYTESVLLQYSWLWEYCGHFARSFSADELWRERGHTCGNDLLSLFREVDSTSCVIMNNFHDWKTKSIVETASHGQVSLKSLTGIVVLPDDFEQIERSVLQKKGCHEAISTAKSLIYQKSEIKRDELIILVAATLCYSNAIDGQRSAKQSPENVAAPPLLFQRLGDACNEIGQILLQSSRQVLISDLRYDVAGNSTAIEKSYVSAIMLTSAQFWFVEGLKQFNLGNDLRNIALLRCNLAQTCKIRANSNVVLPGSGDVAPDESEQYLQQAVDHLVLAHESMGQRETDQRTWDMVSEELAATLVRNIQMNSPALMMMSLILITLDSFKACFGSQEAAIFSVWGIIVLESPHNECFATCTRSRKINCRSYGTSMQNLRKPWNYSLSTTGSSSPLSARSLLLQNMDMPTR